MKNKSEQVTLEKNSTNYPKKHIEHKYLNRNSTSANISTELNNNLFNKIEDLQYQTIEKDSEKNKKFNKNNINKNLNFSQGNYYTGQKIDSLQRNGHYKKIYLPKEFQSYHEYKNKNNKNLKPFNLYSQSIGTRYKQKNIQNIQNNSNNYLEENIYPSNYSYYEYRYLKKKTVPKKEINFNNNIQITSKYGKDNHNKNSSNVSLKANQNLKKIQIINNHKNSAFINVPSEKKKSEVYYKIKKDKINSSTNSSCDSKKKNLILKNTLNISNIQPYDDYNNTFIQTNTQPRTPSLFSKSKVYSPIKAFVNENIKKNVDNLSNKEDFKNPASKSTERIYIKKLEFIQPKTKNVLMYKKKIYLPNDNKFNITDLNNRFATESNQYSPRVLKHFEKVNTILDNKEKYNNNITITINDTNGKKKINKNINNTINRNIIKNLNKNINLNIDSKPKNLKIQEHLKSYSEFLHPNQGKYTIKNDTNLTGEKNNNILKDIKILDSNKLKNLSSLNNNITKITIYKNNKNEKDNLKNIKNKISNVIKKNNKEEKECMNEIENIMYDNYTDPNQINYTYKDNKNFNQKKDNKNANVLTKGRIGTNQELIETYNNQQTIQPKKKINEKNNLNENKNNNNKTSTNSNINVLEHIKKTKSNDMIIFTNIKKNNLIINNNSNVNNSNNKVINNSNINIANNKALNNSNINNANNKALNNNNANNANNKALNNNNANNLDNKVINNNNANNVDNKVINNNNVGISNNKAINNSNANIANNKVINNNIVNISNNKAKNSETNNKAINNSIVNNINNKTISNNSVNISNIKVINNNLATNPNNKIINNININKLENEKKNNNIIINPINLKNINQPDGNKNPITPRNDPNLTKNAITERNKNPKLKLHRNLSEIPKNSSRIDEASKNEEKITKKIDEDWAKIQYKGMRKKTYDPGRRPRKKNKSSNINKKNTLKEQFSSTIFVKASEGFTQAGEIEKGKRKKNQDTFIIERNINGVLNFNIFGVFDGHGDDGHFASQFVKRYIINRIKNHPLIKRLDEPQDIYTQLKEKGFDIITNIFIDADSQIQKEKFDFTRSGTTVVLIIQLEEHVICANTGDSRAIAVYDDKYEDNLANSKIFHLSYDCKPELPNEKRRIYECGGEVDKAYYSDDEDESIIPFRVWAKGESYPGLAMSRSIGDMDAKKIGVIPNPQFVEYTIDYFSKYILICSDGIWEFMSNEEAMKISNKFYLRNDPIGLCHELYQNSVKLWDEKEIVTDDITIVVVFF